MPRWTTEQYTAHMTKQVLATTKTAYDFITPEQAVADTQRRSQGAQPQCTLRHDVDEPAKGQGSNPAGCFVRITSRRNRLIDPDNLVPKYFIDALRYAGAISDDSAKAIQLQVQQEKPAKGQPEETLIEIWK